MTLDIRLGRLKRGPSPGIELRIALISQLADVPKRMRGAVAHLSEQQLNTAYRPGGWIVRQIVHHLADAQMNWYLRTKLALTENEPRVKPYDEAARAELHDARTAPVEPSLILLDALHQRWVELCTSIAEGGWKRTLVHPDRGVFVLDSTLAMHIWHGHHHTPQIVNFCEHAWAGNNSRIRRSRLLRVFIRNLRKPCERRFQSSCKLDVRGSYLAEQPVNHSFERPSEFGSVKLPDQGVFK